MATTGTANVGFFQAQLDAMSPRDRKLLTGLVIILAVVGAAMLWYLLYTALDTKASRVRAAKDKLTEVLSYQQDYLVAAEEIRVSEERLRQYENQRLSPFLEKLAKQHGIESELSKVDELSSTQVGNLEQTSYKVELKKVEMDKLWSFLYDMETEGYPLKVDNARFTVSHIKRVKHLDLTMEVVVYTLQEGA